MSTNIEEIEKHYSDFENVEPRIKLATTNSTGRLITHNFKKIVQLGGPYAPNEKVVDVGCGFGYLLRFLPEDVDVCAIDISQHQLDVARRFRKNFTGLVCDAHDLKEIKDNTFDKLFSINLTPHLLDVDKALKEFFRITKPGGLAIINFLNKYSPNNIPFTIFGLNIGYYFKKGIQTPSPQFNVSYLRAKKLVKSAEFELINSYGTGIPFPYSLEQKLPSLAKKWTDITISTQDLPVFKHFSSSILFRLRKPFES